MIITIPELRWMEEGVILDITVIGSDHMFARQAAHTGETFRIMFQRVEAKINSPSGVDAPRKTPRSMPKITSTMVWGMPVYEDLPTGVTAPDVPEERRDQTTFGFHDWLIEKIELVEGS